MNLLRAHHAVPVEASRRHQSAYGVVDRDEIVEEHNRRFRAVFYGDELSPFGRIELFGFRSGFPHIHRSGRQAILRQEVVLPKQTR
jgi:hypothetical protein